MTAEDPVSAVTVEGLDPRLRILRCGHTVDTFAVVTERYLVVIDTMVNLETMEEAMDLLQPDLRSRQLLVINTHGDWDHVWGNGLFLAPNALYPAPVIGSCRTADVMRSSETQDFLQSFKAQHPGRYDSAEFWPPSIQFDDGLTVDGGDLHLRIFPTPGHTPDHHSVWIPELRTVLTGDAAELPLPLVKDAATLPELRASLQRLDELRADRAMYSHALGSTDPVLIRHNLTYFDELEARCREVLGSGTDAYSADTEADPAVVIDWPLSRALPPGVTMDSLPQPEFYERAHKSAIRAMLEWL